MKSIAFQKERTQKTLCRLALTSVSVSAACTAAGLSFPEQLAMQLASLLFVLVRARLPRLPRAHHLAEAALAGVLLAAANVLLLTLRMAGRTGFFPAALLAAVSTFLLTAPLVFLAQSLCEKKACPAGEDR